MTVFTKFVVAAGLVAAVTAQNSSDASVTQIFIPFADQQPLVASVIGQSGDVKTLAISCPSGTDVSDCGFPEPLTITAGPSTVHYNPTGIYEAIGEYDCKITGTSYVSCAATIGLYGDAADNATVTTPAPSSSTTGGVQTGTDVLFNNITITAGLKANTSATTTGKSSSGSHSMTATASLTGSATVAVASGNGASHLSGLAALVLAAPLLLL